MKRTEIIKVYVSEHEKIVLQENAKKMGVSLSVLLRNQGLTPNRTFDPIIFAEVNEILNDIDRRHVNEITHSNIMDIYDLLGGNYNGCNENCQ